MKKLIFGMMLFGIMLAVADTANAQGVIRGLGDKCIEVKGGETYDGAKVQLWECHGGSNQLWYMNMQNEIVNEKSKKCLTVMGTGKIAIWTCDLELNKQWQKTKSGEFRGVGNKCLDLSGSNTNNGTPILLYQCTGNPNQKWRLVIYEPTVKHYPPNSSYKYCSNEGGRCNFNGTTTVAYGVNGKFKYRRNVRNSAACSNRVFGDPAPGVNKRCYYLLATPAVNGYNVGFIEFKIGNYKGYFLKTKTDGSTWGRYESVRMALEEENYVLLSRTPTVIVLESRKTGNSTVLNLATKSYFVNSRKIGTIIRYRK